MERLEENSLRWMNIGHASSAVSDFLKKNYITTIHCLHFRITNNKSLAWKKKKKCLVKEKEWARKQTEREKEEVASLETACLIRKTIVPAQSDIYSEEELSRVEQKYRRRKREREREVKRDEGEKTAPRATLERASMRECAAQWLLIAFKSASRHFSSSSALARAFVPSPVPSFNLGHVSDDFQARTWHEAAAYSFPFFASYFLSW